jgi:hypothetical protein
MAKYLWILVGLLLVVLLAKPLRDRVKPYAGPVLNPIYSWSTRNTISDLTKDLHDEKSLGRTLPDAKKFQRFVEEKRPGDTVDAWGNPYYLLSNRKTVRVGSMGVDGVRGNSDDILSPPVAR